MAKVNRAMPAADRYHDSPVPGVSALMAIPYAVLRKAMTTMAALFTKWAVIVSHSEPERRSI